MANANDTLEDYCSRCGAPLTIQEINENNKNQFETTKEVISKLNEIAEENQTDSFVEILKTYLEELD